MTSNEAEPGSPPGRPGPAASQPGRVAAQASGPSSGSSSPNSPTQTLSANHSIADPPRPSGPPARPRPPWEAVEAAAHRATWTLVPRRSPSTPRADWSHTTCAVCGSGRRELVSAQTPPTSPSSAAPPTKGVDQFMPMARTADGRTMVLVRSSAVFLWHADAPDKIVTVIPPPRSVTEPAPRGNVQSVTNRGRRFLPRRPDLASRRSNLSDRSERSASCLGARRPSRGRGIRRRRPAIWIGPYPLPREASTTSH